MTASTPSYQTSQTSNPFPGLRSFLDSESHLFFGRKTHIAEVREKLERNHFVAVVGTSGTGKSSLIRAGLLPALQKEMNAEGQPLWRLMTITPGSSPLDNLARALAQNFGDSHDLPGRTYAMLQLLRESSLGLVQALRPLLPAGQRLLLLVDQFEEVFRFSDGEAHASQALYDAFVQIITDTVRQRDVPVYAILTLRSDFLGDCVDYEGLPEAINDGHYLVPRMNTQQLREAITGPVDTAKGKISPRLVQHIHQHLGHNADQLPVLQHAMMRTWDYWKIHSTEGEPIDLVHFEAVGGLANALSSHADEAFDELDATEQGLAEQVFKCLTTKQADNRGVRRPLPLRELASITRQSEEAVLACLKPFRKAGRSFVLPGIEVQARSTTIFDISHESLMRGWKRLHTWVDEEMESAEFYARICTAALLHERGASALWRNPELQLALDWKTRQQPSEPWAALYNPHLDAALGFLDASEKAYREERRRKRKRLAVIRGAVATFVVVVSVLAAWALNQTRVAQAKTAETELKTLEALEQKGLAETAREEALKASELAELARLRAEEQAALAETQERIAMDERRKAEKSAMRAMEGEEQAIAQKELADRKSREAEQQRQKADSARLETTRLRLIALGQKLAFEANQVTQNAELSGLLAIEAYQLARDNGGNTNEGTLYAAATRAMKELSPELSSVVHQHPHEVLAMSAAGHTMVLADRAGKLQRFTLPVFDPKDEISTGLVSADINTAFLDDGGSVAAFGLNDYRLTLVDLNQPDPSVHHSGHKGLVRALAFPRGNTNLITGGRDQRVLIWRGASDYESMDMNSRVKGISPTPDGTAYYVGCEDGKVYRVNPENRERHIFAERPGVRVTAMTISESGELLAVGYSDGHVQVLHRGGKLTKELSASGSVSHLSFDESRDALAVATAGKMLNLYALSNLTALPISIRTDRPIKALATDRMHGDLYLCTNDGKVQRFPVRTESLIADLRSKIQRNLSLEEWQTFMGSDMTYPYLQSLKP